MHGTSAPRERALLTAPHATHALLRAAIEREVVMLVLGRLVALTDADEGLCRLVLPLLTDALATQTSGADAEVC